MVSCSPVQYAAGCLLSCVEISLTVAGATDNQTQEHLHDHDRAPNAPSAEQKTINSAVLIFAAFLMITIVIITIALLEGLHAAVMLLLKVTPRRT